MAHGDRATRGIARHARPLIFLALLLAYAIRLWQLHGTVVAPRLFHDTDFYFAQAEGGWFSAAVWGGNRAPLPVLIFKWCACDPELIRRVFLASSAASWSLLAWVVSRAPRAPGLGLVGAALVLALAQSPRVASWNDVILSESLSLSCWALTVAMALLFVARPARFLVPLVLSAALLVLSRDSNAFLVVMIVPALLGYAAYLRFVAKAPWWPASAAAGCFLGLFLLGNASANRGERWQYPLVNVIVWRVLPEASVREAFEARGMPQLPGLRAKRARKAYDRDQSLAPFFDWLARSGKSTYVRFLLSHPGYLLGRPAPELGALLGSELADYAPRRSPPLAPTLADAPWQGAYWWLQGLLACVLTVAVLVVPALRRTPLALLGALSALLAYPHALVVFHGDAMEVPRHGLQVALQLQLACLLLLLAVADFTARALAERRRARAPRAAV